MDKFQNINTEAYIQISESQKRNSWNKLKDKTKQKFKEEG